MKRLTEAELRKAQQKLQAKFRRLRPHEAEHITVAIEMRFGNNYENLGIWVFNEHDVLASGTVSGPNRTLGKALDAMWQNYNKRLKERD